MTTVMERAQSDSAGIDMNLASSDRGPHAVGGAESGTERL
jgi:hypothetical protein